MTTYTDKMIATIKAEQPLNLDKAHNLANELGVSYRSIISKAKQLGFTYEKKAKPAKKGSNADGVTKKDILVQIRIICELPDRDGDLTKLELENVLAKLK